MIVIIWGTLVGVRQLLSFLAVVQPFYRVLEVVVDVQPFYRVLEAVVQNGCATVEDMKSTLLVKMKTKNLDFMKIHLLVPDNHPGVGTGTFLSS